MTSLPINPIIQAQATLPITIVFTHQNTSVFWLGDRWYENRPALIDLVSMTWALTLISH
jgi:hypothetical protein